MNKVQIEGFPIIWVSIQIKLPFVVLVGYGAGNLRPGRETNRLVYFLTKVLNVLHGKSIFFVCN
jgi:hypothetical protein